MAWVEGRGRSWRVRFRRADGSVGTIGGFVSETAATDHAREMKAAPRRPGTGVDPTSGLITVNEFLPDWVSVNGSGSVVEGLRGEHRDRPPVQDVLFAVVGSCANMHS